MESNIIEVDVKDIEEVFNPFNENQISDELGRYIFLNSKKGMSKAELMINIDNKIPFDEEERERLVDAIRTYFGLLVREKMIYKRNNSIKKIILLIIGVLLIIIASLSVSVVGFVGAELISTIGKVALWELAHILLFEDRKERFDLKKLKELSECEVIFKNKK
ncbi:MAG: hypothetical protein IJO43_00890 [Bacilli bacterium]|nr:hypothetical protein [Bacilli bacterium]